MESRESGTKPALRAYRAVAIKPEVRRISRGQDHRAEPGYSSFAPESLTRVAHFGASTAMKAPKSCGDPIFACALNLSKFALISGDGGRR